MGGLYPYTERNEEKTIIGFALPWLTIPELIMILVCKQQVNEHQLLGGVIAIHLEWTMATHKRTHTISVAT